MSFTRLRIPQIPSTGNDDVDSAVRAIIQHFRSLEGVGALSISQAQIYVDQGLQFPATQVVSADPNNFDDYVEGSTTPTPVSGTGTLTTASATLTYQKKAREVSFRCTITITTNGTGGTYIEVAMPYLPAVITAIYGFDNALGVALTGFVTAAGNARVFKYDGTYPAASGRTYEIAGTYSV